MIRVEVHPDALLELESARDWYRERSEIAAAPSSMKSLVPSKSSHCVLKLGL